MIQLICSRYRKTAAWLFLTLFYLSTALTGYAGGGGYAGRGSSQQTGAAGIPASLARPKALSPKPQENKKPQQPARFIPQSKKFIGGPSQPEMASFKPVGVDNMVNLFTGDFSYNIPLLDVGGYPVNIYYNGNPGMEDEASWVGLGWNINPGSVTRNMRGIPDDFNGQDTMTEIQTMKPNKTWGVRFGTDFELIGIKDVLNIPIGLNLGMSFNNYLGPALELGIKGGVNFGLANNVRNIKSGKTDTLKLGFSVGLNASSRNGATLSPLASFSYTGFKQERGSTAGFSLGTSYNSRTGIKDLQLSEQMSFSRQRAPGKEHYGDKKYQQNSSVGQNIFSSSISFAKPSYTPVIRMPVTNSAGSGHFQLGSGLFGAHPNFEVEVYAQKSEIEATDTLQLKPMVGYMYYENAVNNPSAVMDFTRLNDREVTGNTPIISAPQYAYDVFAIQGEGTGGSIRAFRNDLGYVRDNFTQTRDKSFSLGFDIGPIGHYGGNFNTVKTPSSIGEWGNGNKLKHAMSFRGVSGSFENVYFRNPGESTVLDKTLYDKIGGTKLVRFKLGGSDGSPTIEPYLEAFNRAGYKEGTSLPVAAGTLAPRQKRTQVVSFLTAAEASRAGLDTSINSIKTLNNPQAGQQLVWPSPRVSGYRKSHHISQINVTEADGQRYIYGIPVYNIKQADYTFSINNTSSSNAETAADADKVTIDESWMTTSSGLLEDRYKDGYIQITKTPAYAHSFLLTGLLSPDYVDVRGDGITDDDLGNAVKFSYTQFENHRWRTPLGPDKDANFNPGNRSETKDDKGIVSYGERESWYLQSIESKTMIAVFTLQDRFDGKGASGPSGGLSSGDASMKCLKQIDLFTRADYYAHGHQDARPIKTVRFDYSYNLCKGTPDNPNGAQGKLTLEKIRFTFNGQNRSSANQYVFAYSNSNPGYITGGSDRWGNYKDPVSNPSAIKNKDYPYSLQPNEATGITKQDIDAYASSWALSKILLPSGGEIDVEYECDDYAYVQNRRAAAMMKVRGFSKTNILSQGYSDRMYDSYAINGGEINNNYVFIDVPQACTSQNMFQKYLEGLTQLVFKYRVRMEKGYEYLTCYAHLSGNVLGTDFGVTSDSKVIWVRLKTVDGFNPLNLTALEYLKEQLPGQAFEGHDVSEESGLEQIGTMLTAMLASIGDALKNPIKVLRDKGRAQRVDLSRSFVRLNDPDGFKYGGGSRVKAIRLKDNWKKMTGQYNSVYGQKYEYTTTEIFNGEERTISSGVASWEPAIGGEENPFQTIVEVKDKLPLGPASYGAVEMPVLDAFFPAPVVGYSKVTVRSIKSTDEFTSVSQRTSKSGIGRQVSEYYTAKDFPVYYDHTSLDPASDKESHASSTMAFFFKYAFDSRALSQGFLVETNDMHGKLKSQSSYAENDDGTRINYTENFYRNTGRDGAEEFDFINGLDDGKVNKGLMGVDVELMTDTREFTVRSESGEAQLQVDLFPVFFPIWIPFPWYVSGTSEDIYRAVTTTKVVNYHSILDSVVVIDKGSMVSTKNLAYDAETGAVLVNRTNNEFDKFVYTTSYPAYWAYSGMGPAYRNINAVYTGVNFLDGSIQNSGFDHSIFESGDELLILSEGGTGADCYVTLASASQNIIWAFDTSRNSTSLATTPYFKFLDTAGRPYTKPGVSFRIIRSGKRNMLGANIASVTSMVDPISGNPRKLRIGSASDVINASAVEYKEKWQISKDAIRTLTERLIGCDYVEFDSCGGYLEKKINPYRKGLLGNYRAYRNMVFYNDRKETQPVMPAATLAQTDLPRNGFLKDFSLYWDFNVSHKVMPDLASNKWVWNSEATRFNSRGLELETRNALNIYTAAQYGYSNSLPLQITNNAKYHEAAYEGFEDSQYDNSFYTSFANRCTQNKHFDLSSLNNTTIIKALDEGFTAHSGKYVLKVNSNTASPGIPVSQFNENNYSLQFSLDTIGSLYETGINLTAEVYNPKVNKPVYLYYKPSQGQQYGEIYSAVDDTIIVMTNPGTGTSYLVTHTVEATTLHYIQIGQSGNYVIQQYIQTNVTSNKSSRLQISIPGSSLPIYLEGPENVNENRLDTIFLCAGLYEVRFTAGDNRHETSTTFPTSFHGYSRFNFSINTASEIYKSLNKQVACIYTKPIPGNTAMLNPSFNIPPNTKMLFSAWVRAACNSANTPCPPSTYDDAGHNISVVINGNVFSPAGAVIDGWQKVEGEFTISSGATSVPINLVNTSGKNIYFDDIRLHPFNANMKSYVYDPVTLRLVAELDANNYATFYEYDAEGTLIRTKAETREGIKTINETRSAKQTVITTFQP
ncbi:hypothetical protein [Foetidibacter luteolus]|uniref:hypothetical protein n=1 Tax=Foetidibacter luteolus TaxID=2608880 RepID=UPI00129A25AF|nr:hypothetical protein [Foetidibacter luteolus]